ncbi:uncharacterized protein RAG0_04300 [Rhynchosporium agropyri]|uniref:Uncharacterized protein n=1 Tax=Rhynchosporium agropyri TaxID=914238 RepID=A0A1E1K835_9HELO|nr:uncharacterized protein RAG0_04300 [Rhynchosporium agropyri]
MYLTDSLDLSMLFASSPVNTFTISVYQIGIAKLSRPSTSYAYNHPHLYLPNPKLGSTTSHDLKAHHCYLFGLSINMFPFSLILSGQSHEQSISLTSSIHILTPPYYITPTLTEHMFMSIRQDRLVIPKLTCASSPCNTGIDTTIIAAHSILPFELRLPSNLDGEQAKFDIHGWHGLTLRKWLATESPSRSG